MESHKLVMPEHLNHYGYLFGGYLLKWVDEHAWIAATLEYPGCHFVTRGMDHVEFRESVKKGSILKFTVVKARAGTTSVQYRVTVYRDSTSLVAGEIVFNTNVTFVRIDDSGNKIPLPA